MSFVSSLFAAMLIASSVSAQQASVAIDATQGVHGRVLEAYTEKPVAQVTVEVLTADQRRVGADTTDASGRFSIKLEKDGTFWIRLSRPPAEPIVEGPIDVVAESGVELVLRIDWPSVQPILLDSLVVQVEARSPRLDDVGYYERKRFEGGTFIGPEVLERRTSPRVSSLFRMVPGIRVVESEFVGGLGDYPVTAYSMRTSLSGACWPRVYLNGMLVEPGGYNPPGGALDSLVPAADVIGIEIYSSPAEVPIQYGGASGAACGVYLIWMK